MTVYNVFSYFNVEINRNYIDKQSATEYARQVNGAIDEFETTMHDIIRYSLPFWDMSADQNPMTEQINVAFNVI